MEPLRISNVSVSKTLLRAQGRSLSRAGGSVWHVWPRCDRADFKADHTRLAAPCCLGRAGTYIRMDAAYTTQAGPVTTYCTQVTVMTLTKSTVSQGQDSVSTTQSARTRTT